MIYFVARNRAFSQGMLRLGASLAMVTGLLATGGVLLLAPALSGHEPDLTKYIGLVSLAIVPLLLISVCRGLAVGLQAWTLVRAEQLTRAVVSLALIAGLSATGELTVGRAIATASLAPVVSGIVYLRITRESSQMAQVARPGGREIVSYAWRSWFGSTSGIAVARLDQALMTLLSSSYALGLYAVAVAVSEIPLIINSAVSLVSFSTDAADRSDERLAMSARISSTVCFVIAAVLCGLAWLIFPWLFGPGFAAAVPTTVVLTCAVAAGAPGSIAGSALSARGRPAVRSAGLLGAAAINVVLLLTLVPTMGAMGAALATVGATAFANAWCLWFLRRLYGIDPRSFYGVRRRDIRIIVDSVRAHTRRSA
jgi:O-antigen/teichoic acid export membrane protein